ncbi:hypothetical protein J0H58_28190 [bacterium]|nr:hypothetical protein [bacterium]
MTGGNRVRPVCICGAAAPPDENGVCPGCRRVFPGAAPSGGPVPTDLIARLARNEQGSVPPPQPWRILFGSGTVTGVLMMGGAVAWFGFGLLAGRIFFYPPILFGMGALAVLRDVCGVDDRY